MPDFQPQVDSRTKSSVHRKLVFQQNRPGATSSIEPLLLTPFCRSRLTASRHQNLKVTSAAAACSTHDAAGAAAAHSTLDVGERRTDELHHRGRDLWRGVFKVSGMVAAGNDNPTTVLRVQMGKKRSRDLRLDARI